MRDSYLPAARVARARKHAGGPIHLANYSAASVVCSPVTCCLRMGSLWLGLLSCPGLKRPAPRTRNEMPKDGATLLSDLTTDALIVRCDVCRRLGRYSVERLLARRGDMRLTDFLTERTVNCPKVTAGLFTDTCKARFDFSLEAGALQDFEDS
jgi:hypothetical protein